MKTNNINNYRLVKSCFIAFCEENYLVPYNNCVVWEHEGFSCSAENAIIEESVNYRAVDACCEYCKDGNVDYCFNCHRNNQIDFEQV